MNEEVVTMNILDYAELKKYDCWHSCHEYGSEKKQKRGFKEWFNQYDWGTERKILDAVITGIGLGIWLDILLLIAVRI